MRSDSQRTVLWFSENREPENTSVENRRTSPCSPRAPNLLHVLPSRMVGWNDLCTPEFLITIIFLIIIMVIVIIVIIIIMTRAFLASRQHDGFHRGWEQSFSLLPPLPQFLRWYHYDDDDVNHDFNNYDDDHDDLDDDDEDDKNNVSTGLRPLQQFLRWHLTFDDSVRLLPHCIAFNCIDDVV